MKKAGLRWASQPAGILCPRVATTFSGLLMGPAVPSNENSTMAYIGSQPRGPVTSRRHFPGPQKEPSQKSSWVTNSPAVVAPDRRAAVPADGRRELETRNGFSPKRGVFPGNGRLVDAAKPAYVLVRKVCSGQNPA
jgi:hypothetical protein